MNNTLKRIACLLLALVLAGSASGCSFLRGNAAGTETQTETTIETESATEPESQTDASVSTSGETSSASGESSAEQTQLGPTVAEELVIADGALAQIEENAGNGQMTALTDLLGQTWYVARGSADDDFTVDGESVAATPVDAAGTIYKWAQNDVSGQTVYGEANVPYADFYYGELNAVTADDATVVDVTAAEPEVLNEYRQEGMFDAVTSATSRKWKQQSGTYTQANEKGSGGQILGVSGLCIAVDADLFVNAVLLYAMEIDCGTALETLAVGMSLLEEPEAVYKTLYADGVLSAITAEQTQLEASFTLSTRSKYGDYELKTGRMSLYGTVLGVILVTDDGSEYALCHLENIWGNGRELAWYSYETNGGRYLPYEGLPGSTITEIRYITSAGVTVCGGLELVIG